jgi:hypothetical protein
MEIGKVPLCHSLIEFLCFFCAPAPSKHSILQFPKGLFGTHEVYSIKIGKNSCVRNRPKYFQSIGFKMLGYCIPMFFLFLCF